MISDPFYRDTFFLETSAFNETETIDEINDIHANNCDYTNVHSQE